MANALAINMYRYWQSQNGIKAGFFGILRRKFRRVLTVLPKFKNLRAGTCTPGRKAFIIRFTSRRKEVKPLTEGGRTVLILFVTAAAASDLRWGRIYNFLTLPTLAAGLLLLMMNTPEELPPMLGVIAATLLLLFPFWKAGGLGAGDIKLLMALAPFMGPGWFLFGTVLSFLIGAGISHQRRALSASRAARNTEPIPGNFLISARHVTGRPAGFILMRPQEDLLLFCALPDERRASND